MSLRRSIEVATTDNVSHGALLVIAFAVAAVGVLVLVVSKCATNFAIGTGATLVLAGVTIAVPARARQARHELTCVVRAIRGTSPSATIPPRRDG